MELDNYLIWGCVVLLFICMAAALKLLKSKKASSSKNAFINEILEKASAQKSTVDLKLGGDEARSGLSCEIAQITAKGILLATGHDIPEEWARKPVEAFLRVEHDGAPVFFVFDSTTGDVRQSEHGQALFVNMPVHLRVEKKRHFPRERPNQSDILMLAVWPITPGKRLPRRNSELGTPAMSWKAGHGAPQVQVENVSASGIALRFTAPISFDVSKGRQISGLLVYNQDASNRMIFLFTAEIMNSRSNGGVTSLGLEFTNWAAQSQEEWTSKNQAEAEIHWAHSSPWRGVKPMHQWVEQIEKSKKN